MMLLTLIASLYIRLLRVGIPGNTRCINSNEEIRMESVDIENVDVVYNE